MSGNTFQTQMQAEERQKAENMKTPVLLVYHMDPSRQATLAKVCSSLKIRVSFIEDSESKAPVGLLTGREDPMKVIRESAKRTHADGRQQPVDEEMIVMSGFPEEMFSRFLRTIRENGLVIELKAVETDENCFWSGEMLQKELKKERKAFRQR